MLDHYPPATQRPVPYCGEAGPFPAPPLGWILHVVVGNGSPWPTFARAVPPNRRFSHLWVAKTGTIEQYAPLTSKSWAQAAGNPTYWSVETEGLPSEPLTDAQLDALAAWHVWCGAPDALAEAPGQRGIGTHYMGGVAWGQHSCPGPIRAAQRTEILRRAAALRHPQEDDMTASDVWHVGWPAPVPSNPDRVELAQDRLLQAARTASALAPKLDALATTQQAQAAQLAQLAAGLQSVLDAVRALAPRP